MTRGLDRNRRLSPESVARAISTEWRTTREDIFLPTRCDFGIHGEGWRAAAKALAPVLGARQRPKRCQVAATLVNLGLATPPLSQGS